MPTYQCISSPSTPFYNQQIIRPPQLPVAAFPHDHTCQPKLPTDCYQHAFFSGCFIFRWHACSQSHLSALQMVETYENYSLSLSLNLNLNLLHPLMYKTVYFVDLEEIVSYPNTEHWIPEGTFHAITHSSPLLSATCTCDPLTTLSLASLPSMSLAKRIDTFAWGSIVDEHVCLLTNVEYWGREYSSCSFNIEYCDPFKT